MNHIVHKRLLIILILFFGFKGILFSQNVKTFSSDTSLFINELSEKLKSVGPLNEKSAKTAISDFQYAWQSELLTPMMKGSIYNTCLLFDNFQLQAFPYYLKYINILNYLARNTTPINTFEEFNKSIYLLSKLKSPTLLIRDYLQQMELFFLQKSFQKTATEEWFYENGEYVLGNDSMPFIAFKNIDLKCKVRGDSIGIYETHGKFIPTNKDWYGNKGKVFWEKHGYHRDSLFVNLNDYKLNMQFTRYTAEPVELHFESFYKDKFITGKFEDMPVADRNEITSTFPRFYMDKKFHIHMNLFKNIEFQGIYNIEGNKLIGVPSDRGIAQINIFKDNKPFVTMKSDEFLIRAKRFVTNKAEVAIELEEDSIFHPSASVKFNSNDNILLLERTNEGLGMSPFADSYHKLDIFSEAAYWNLDSTNITFEAIRGNRSKSDAQFVSSDYFTQYEYEVLRGIDDANPAELVSLYARRNKIDTFEIDEYANFIKKPKEQTHFQLIKLANKGLISYDLSKRIVKIKPRLLEFLAAQKGVKDSDILYLKSKVGNTHNAILNLKDNRLKIYGVPKIMLSDSQYVYVVPENEQIIMSKNRNFAFSGRVHAGLFDFQTKDSHFDYGTFSITMPEIETASMVALSWEPDAMGFRPFVKVTNTINQLNAVLFIDNPDNKSGRKMLYDYPRLDSKEPSFVYYDRKDIADGAYKKDEFYFTVYPFVMDSINSIPTPNVRFAGKLFSGNIFPEIEEELRIQKDYSLGFEHYIDENGLAMYGGKGSYKDSLVLNNKGLTGSGELSYLTSENQSSNFLFTPEQTTALVDNYNLRQQVGDVEYPDAVTDKAQIKWLAKEDYMEVSSRDKSSFAMFNDNAKLDGILKVTPKGLKGEGLFSFENAEVFSNNYTFKANSLISDTADFKLINPEFKKDALLVHVFKTEIDFLTRRGHFIATGEGALMEFPLIKYQCVVDEFDWLMDENKLNLANNTNFTREKYYQMSPQELLAFDPGKEIYSSTALPKDNINFFALKATYDLMSNTLNVEDARVVKVADAAVFPYQGKMLINKDGVIETLKNADIIANRESLLYKFYNSNVNLVSAKSYKADGLYDYKPINGNQFTLKIDEIFANSKATTVAKTAISDSLDFHLNTYFKFEGNMEIAAANNEINFEGGLSMSQNCDTLRSYKVKINEFINPKNIIIPIKNDLESIDNQKLRKSIFFSLTENKIMSGFLSPPTNVTDPDLVSATGFLTFKPQTSQYIIADTSKINNSFVEGNLISHNITRCITHGEGKVNIANNTGRLEINSAGSVDFFQLADSTVANIISAMNFHFNKDALDIFHKDINASSSRPIDINKENYIKNLKDLLGKKTADKIVEDLSLYGKVQKMPDAADFTIVLSDINLYYNKDNRSFISTGNIGVHSISNKMVMKYLDGYVEIQKRRSGDYVNIYLETDAKEWYFFSYSNNIMQAISSNASFNEIIGNAKAKDRKIETKDGLPQFQYLVGTPDKKNTFLRKMQQIKSEENND